MTLSEIYYQPEHLWTGRKAIKLLQKESGQPVKRVRAWLALQALWQVHLPRSKIEYAHFRATKVNKIHQADLLYLPHDKVYQTTYKYLLNVVDIASGYKASKPLKTKKASEVASMFADIYKKGSLKYPEELHVSTVAQNSRRRRPTDDEARRYSKAYNDQIPSQIHLLCRKLQ